MALLDLFRRNAELCTEMASAAKSAEVREQWVELAKHWWQKAEAEQHQAGIPASQDPFTPTLTAEERDDGEELVQVLSPLTQSLPPPETSFLSVENYAHDDDLGADCSAFEDALWNQLLTDIRPQHRR